MRHTDIAIVGGGLAGSTAAAMLGRAGLSCDPDRSSHPLSARLPLREARWPASPPAGENRPCRCRACGHHTRSRCVGGALRPRDREKTERSMRHPVRPAGQRGPRRNPAGRGVHSSQGRGDRDQQRSATGNLVDRRASFRASGRAGERAQYRFAPHARHDARGREPCHSVTIGFDISPVGRPSFDFRALSYYTERVGDRTAYLTLFPIGATMRANRVSRSQ